jgi:hypothetical protein
MFYLGGEKVCISILSVKDQTANEDDKDIVVTTEDIKDTTDTLHSTSEDKEEENEQALYRYVKFHMLVYIGTIEI